MNKKSGKAGSPIAPIAPASPHEADKADPGEVDKIKAEERRTESGKYGSVKVKPFKPPPPENAAATSADTLGQDGSSSSAAQGEEPKKKSWIEIELVGDDNQPISGEKYRITLPDDSVDEGVLDHQGSARVEGFERGTCKISFPELDQEAWKEA